MPSAISTAISQADYDRLNLEPLNKPSAAVKNLTAAKTTTLFVLKPYSFDPLKVNKSFVDLCLEGHSRKTFRV